VENSFFLRLLNAQVLLDLLLTRRLSNSRCRRTFVQQPRVSGLRSAVSPPAFDGHHVVLVLRLQVSRPPNEDFSRGVFLNFFAFVHLLDCLKNNAGSFEFFLLFLLFFFLPLVDYAIVAPLDVQVQFEEEVSEHEEDVDTSVQTDDRDKEDSVQAALLEAWHEVAEAHEAVQDVEADPLIEQFHFVREGRFEWPSPAYQNDHRHSDHQLDSYLSPEELLPEDQGHAEQSPSKEEGQRHQHRAPLGACFAALCALHVGSHRLRVLLVVNSIDVPPSVHEEDYWSASTHGSEGNGEIVADVDPDLVLWPLHVLEIDEGEEKELGVALNQQPD